MIALRFRVGKPEMLGLETEAPLSDAWLARVAPDVLHPIEPRKASVDIYVGLSQVVSAKPDVEGLRSTTASDWPMDAIEVSARVVVRVKVFSADLAIPGWALSYDEIWFG